MDEPDRPIKALGEIFFDVKHLQSMQEFDEIVIRFEIMQRFDDSVFFKVSPSYRGHTRVLGLFKESLQPDHPSR